MPATQNQRAQRPVPVAVPPARRSHRAQTPRASGTCLRFLHPVLLGQQQLLLLLQPRLSHPTAPRDCQLRNRRSYLTPANCNNSSAWCRRSPIEFSFWTCCLSYGIAYCLHLRACCYSSDGCGATCCFQRSWFGPRHNFR